MERKKIAASRTAGTAASGGNPGGSGRQKAGPMSYEAVYRRVNGLIEGTGLKKGAVMREFGMTPPELYSLRRHRMSPELMYRVSQYFGVTMEYILTGQASGESSGIPAAGEKLSESEKVLLCWWRGMDDKFRKGVLHGIAPEGRSSGSVRKGRKGRKERKA